MKRPQMYNNNVKHSKFLKYKFFLRIAMLARANQHQFFNLEGTPYVEEKKIGRGAFGVVCKAKQTVIFIFILTHIRAWHSEDNHLLYKY